jgi:hypothetical protein
MKKLLIIAALIAALFVSPARAASIYYSSPSGSGTACAIEAPCSLTTGLGKLTSGSTLYLMAGTYGQLLKVTQSGVTVAGYPGQVAIINPPTTSSQYTPALSVSGSNNTVQHLEVTFPSGKGVEVSGNGNTVTDINAHIFQTSGLTVSGQQNTISNSSISEAWYQGVVVTGPNNLFLGNYVFHDVRSNDCAGGGTDCNGDRPGTFSIDARGANTSGTILRGNHVYESYGEGIMCMSCTDVIIEGNVVYDNLPENIYFEHSVNSIARGNFVYYSTNHEYWLSSSHPQAGITWANESGQNGPISNNLKIYNNIIVNAGWGIASNAGGSMLIANNTVVTNFTTLDIDPGTSTVENNIFIGPMGAHSGATFSNNLTSSPAFVGGAAYDPASYALQATSSAIGKAVALVEVSMDFFGNARDANPDIGASEYGGIVPVFTFTPTNVNTPTIINTSTRTPTRTRTPTPFLPTAAPTETNTLIPNATIAPTLVSTLTPDPTLAPCVWVVTIQTATHIEMDCK